MTGWYHYSCLDCGYGGLTRDRDGFRLGKHPCPRCGSLRFEVEEADAAPLGDEEELGPEIDE